MQFNSKFEIFRKYGSDRREIFIAFAQSGSANSPHSRSGMCGLYLKTIASHRIGIYLETRKKYYRDNLFP